VIRKHGRDAAIVLVLIMLPLLWFGAVTLGGRTLLPVDNLFAFEPWASYAAEHGVSVPHNELLSDLLLENYVWKRLIREAIQAREIPLWNPYIFAGVPFLAAGQHSALYPLSLIFYVLPLSRAYGIFTWLHIAVAGVCTYIFARVLQMRRPAALLASVVYMFSGFFIVSVVFSMIIAAAAWLPLLLACIEIIVRKQEAKGNIRYSPVPYVVAGALVLGVNTLAGHVEVTYYTLLVAGFYAAWRLVQLWRRLGTPRPALRLAAWLMVMVGLGLAMGAVQLMPLYELVSASFRQGSVGYGEVVGWAWPTRQILTFFVPDIFGNPSHHTYWDLWSQAWQIPVGAAGAPARAIDWGVKNYVEGGNYVGILTLLLAVIGVLGQLPWRRKGKEEKEGNEQHEGRAQPVGLFAMLAVLSLLFAFGTPLYAILFYGLPGYKQLHSAFRWVLPYTLSMAVLAGFGFDLLRSEFRVRRSGFGVQSSEFGVRRAVPLSRALGWVALVSGVGVLALLAASLFVPAPFISLGQFVVNRSDLAQAVFADGSAFWSYQSPNLLKFGVMATLAGALLLWSVEFHASRIGHHTLRVSRFTFQLSSGSLGESRSGASLLSLWCFSISGCLAMASTPPPIPGCWNSRRQWSSFCVRMMVCGASPPSLLPTRRPSTPTWACSTASTTCVVTIPSSPADTLSSWSALRSRMNCFSTASPLYRKSLRSIPRSSISWASSTSSPRSMCPTPATRKSTITRSRSIATRVPSPGLSSCTVRTRRESTAGQRALIRARCCC